MPTDDRDHLDAVVGMDKSRRQAWARYYQLLADNERLLANNRTLLTRLAELCVSVLDCEALVVLEEGDEVVDAVRMVLVSLRRSRRGQAVLREVMDRRAEKKGRTDDGDAA